MAAGFRESCKTFCRENICEIVAWFASAGSAAVLVGAGAWLTLDRHNTAQDQINQSTVAALDALTAESREQSKALDQIQIDMAVVKSRMPSPESAFVPAPPLLASPNPHP